MKPVVYAIYSHANPQQVIRLVRTMRKLSPHAHIVVHHDPGHASIDERELRTAGGTLIPNPVRGEWGDFSLVMQHLHAMRWCLDNLDFEWFITLTGQTYPIKRTHEFESMLHASEFDAYINHFDAYDKVVWPIGEASRRYHYRYVKLPKFRYWHRVPRPIRELVPQLIRHFNAAQEKVRIFTYPKGLRTRLGIRASKLPFDPVTMPLVGANLNTNFRRRVLEFILSYVDSHIDYTEHFSHTALPDEAFFGTILCSANKFLIANDSLRHIYWPSHGAASGGILTLEHMPELEASPAHFALKFDENVCPELLDTIDKKLNLPPERDNQ